MNQRNIAVIFTILLSLTDQLPPRTLSYVETTTNGQDKTKYKASVKLVLDLSEQAGALSIQDRYDDALKLLNKAVNEWEKAKTDVGPSRQWSHTSIRAWLLHQIGITYYAKGDYGHAKEYCQRALSIKEDYFRAKNLHINHAEEDDLLKLGIIYQAQGKLDSALKALSRANDQMDQFLFDQLFEQGTEGEKLSGKDLFLSDATDITISFHLNSARASKEAASLALRTVLRRKGRVLDSLTTSTEMLTKFLQPSDGQLLEQFIAARVKQRSLIDRLGSSGDDTKAVIEINDLDGRISRLEEELNQRVNYFYHAWQPLEISTIQNNIPPETVLIEFVRYTPFNDKALRNNARWNSPCYAACVLKRNGTPLWVRLGDANEIDESIKHLHFDLQFGHQLENGEEDFLKQACQDTYDRVFKPIREYLGSAKTLILSPDGALNGIPFSSLMDRRGKYLIEHYSLRYVTSGYDLLRMQYPTPAHETPLIIGNPDFTVKTSNLVDVPETQNCCDSNEYQKKSWQPAMATSELAQYISGILPRSRLRMGKDATKQVLAGAHGPSILLIATHGFFYPTDASIGTAIKLSPSSVWRRLVSAPAGRVDQSEIKGTLRCSGIVLAGANNHLSGACNYGVLSAEDVYRMNLRGTQLVVLVACETGNGQESLGEGVFGLRRAFVVAGSDSQVMTLWSVDGPATAYLISRYFDLLRSGNGRSEALQKAQLEMLNGKVKAWRNPTFWAAFIQSGSWTPLSPSIFRKE